MVPGPPVNSLTHRDRGQEQQPLPCRNGDSGLHKNDTERETLKKSLGGFSDMSRERDSFGVQSCISGVRSDWLFMFDCLMRNFLTYGRAKM